MKLLFINNNMKIGGVQRALLNLLREIHEDYDITLLLFSKEGELLPLIPDDVKVIIPSSAVRFWGMERADTRGKWEWLQRSVLAGAARLFGRGSAFAFSSLFQEKLEGYDVAISFLHSGNPKAFYGGCAEFALRCVKAKKKIVFLHNDFRTIQGDCTYNRKLYRRFDYIAACSEGCRKAFLEVMPELAAKTVVVPNCQDYRRIREMAGESPVSLQEGKLNLFTAARFGKEKGILRAIRAVSHLGPEAEKLCYYIAGDGKEWKTAREMVRQHHLEDVVVLLGRMENPYGYMKAADLLLVPSYAEAAPLVIGEAACLGTPVLTTETSSAKEMVEDTGYGWVCENSQEGLEKGISYALRQKGEILEKKKWLLRQQFDNEQAKSRFMELVRRCTRKE